MTHPDSQAKAKRMRLTVTPELIADLRRVYPDGGWQAVQALYPTMSKDQICKLASNRQITLSAIGQAAKGQRISSALKGRLPTHMSPVYPPWDPRETEYLRTHAATDTDAQIGAYLGRTANSVRAKRREMEIKHSAKRTNSLAVRKTKAHSYADWTKPDPQPTNATAPRPARFASVFHLAQGIHA